jgi:hypothetical protein
MHHFLPHFHDLAEKAVGFRGAGAALQLRALGERGHPSAEPISEAHGPGPQGPNV